MFAFVFFAVGGTLLFTAATTVLLQSKDVGDNTIKFAAWLNVLTVTSAAGLAVYLANRDTPLGTYSSIKAAVRAQGYVDYAINHLDVLFYVILEIAALVYIIAVMYLTNVHQIGLLAAIAAARRRRSSWLSRNWGPTNSRSLISKPLLMLLVLSFAAVFSSPFFWAWIIELGDSDVLDELTPAASSSPPSR